MGKHLVSVYRGYFVRRDYQLTTLWWAEKNEKRLIFGSTEDRVRQKIDRVLDAGHREQMPDLPGYRYSEEDWSST